MIVYKAEGRWKVIENLIFLRWYEHQGNFKFRIEIICTIFSILVKFCDIYRELKESLARSPKRSHEVAGI